MEDLKLLIDLHKANLRQGPGSDTQTLRALELSGLAGRQNLQIADLGCGCGASALLLAEQLDAQIQAVDFIPEFLAELNRRAKRRRVAERISTLELSFRDLSFEPESLDAIWSEGAIYNLGFEAGIEAWKGFLKPGGVLALSEITWLTKDRPAALQHYWDENYSQIDLASTKLAQLEEHGFKTIAYFALPESCWIDCYYRPLQAAFPVFLETHQHSEQARALVAAEQQEIALYEKYKHYFSYGFYLARKWQ